MAHAHPAMFFAKSLWLALDDPTRENVNRELDKCGLAHLDPGQYKELLGSIDPTPGDFRPWDRWHTPSVKWLKRMGIFSLFHKDRVVHEMWTSILFDRKMREDVERLLIGNVSHLEAAYRLQKKGRAVSDGAINEFRHYFWNTRIMGAGDWAHYFRQDGTRTRDLQVGYMAVLHGGPELALYRTGVRTEIDSKQIFDDVMRELWATFQEVRTLPLSGQKVEMLSSLTRGLARTEERRQASDAALQDILKKFEKFRVLADTEQLPSLIDIAPSGTVSDKSRTEILISRET